MTVENATLHTAATDGRRREQGYIRRADMAILPLLVAMPFMYFPKILEGDSQPWILAGAILAFLLFRRDRFLAHQDIGLVGLSFFCVMAFGVRGSFNTDFVRVLYLHMSFIMLWFVLRRCDNDFLPTAVRATIVIWFAVGLYQTIAIAYGLPVAFSGRFVEGRSGIPSLASEPSSYGSLSVIQIMYLLGMRRPKDLKYIAMATASVIMSGSLLALLLLVFPLMRVRRSVIPWIIVVISLFIFIDLSLGITGFSSRLAGFSIKSGLIDILLDKSLNLRFGHIYYTLVVNFFDSVFFLSPVNFQYDYNSFARSTLVFAETGSNFVLPAAGDLIYGSGLFGLGLLAVLLKRTWDGGSTRALRLQRVIFVFACLLNPISIANIFLLIYIQKDE